MASTTVPIIVKHCTLAIYKSGDVTGTPRDKVRGALDIARHQLTRYGFLQEGSETGPVSRIRLTSKGLKRNGEHARESNARTKSKKFDDLFMLIEEELTLKAPDDRVKSDGKGKPAVKK